MRASERWSAQTRISREAHDFKGSWPLTVDEGTLECTDGPIITFEADGHTYAVKENARDEGYPPIVSITVPGATLTGLIQEGEFLCAISGPDSG